MLSLACFRNWEVKKFDKKVVIRKLPFQDTAPSLIRMSEGGKTRKSVVVKAYYAEGKHVNINTGSGLKVSTKSPPSARTQNHAT